MPGAGSDTGVSSVTASSKDSAPAVAGPLPPISARKPTDGTETIAKAAVAASRPWVTRAAARQFSRTSASLSALVEGLIGTKTAPAFSTAKIETTASKQLSVKITTRSPWAIPRANRAAARRSDIRSSSA
ncbi:MAG: hypothetical protein RLT05_36575 [Bauldia litoralis]